MGARPASARKHRSRYRTLGWLATAAVVAVAFLPGTTVPAAFGAAAPHPSADEGYPNAEATPTPVPEPTATPTPSQARIVVSSVIDADGNPATDGDWDPARNWLIELELVAGTHDGDASQLTDSSGGADWTVSFGSAGATATLTEVVPLNFTLLDIACMEDGDGDNSLGIRDRNGVTFDVTVPDAVYSCLFVNAPMPEVSASSMTATPHIADSPTLPPTDTGGLPHAPSSDGWRVMLVVLAGTIAAVLFTFPVRVANRTTPRRGRPRRQPRSASRD